MDEYIDRKQALNLVESSGMWGWSKEQLYDEMQDVPSADVAPVVHGKWLCAETDDEQFFLCSVCNDKEYWESNYCPECGAKMDAEQE